MVVVKFFKDGQALDVDLSAENMLIVRSAPRIFSVEPTSMTFCRRISKLVPRFLQRKPNLSRIAKRMPMELININRAFNECGVITALAVASFSKFLQHLERDSPSIYNDYRLLMRSYENIELVKSWISLGHVFMPSVPLPPCDTAAAIHVLESLSPEKFRQIDSITWAAHDSYNMALTLDTGCSVGHIRRLDLYGISIMPWGPFRGLTHLTLNNILREDICPTSSELVRIIATSSLIQRISLRNLNPAHVAEPAFSEVVTLNHLEFFEMSGLPESVSLYITLHFYIPATAPMWKHCPERGCDILKDHRHGNRCCLRIAPDEVSIKAGGSMNGHAILKIPNKCAMALLDIVDLNHVTELQCFPRLQLESFGELEWTKLLNSAPNLEEVYVSGTSRLVLSFLVALSLPQAVMPILEFMHTNGHRSPIKYCYCPGLTRLNLQISLDVAPEAEVRSACKVLLAHLTKREHLGLAPLEKLEINFGDSEAQEKLRKLVKNNPVSSV